MSHFDPKKINIVITSVWVYCVHTSLLVGWFVRCDFSKTACPIFMKFGTVPNDAVIASGRSRSTFKVICFQARREPQPGARENIIAGPYHLPHSVCLETETPKASRGRKHGERCPLTIRIGVQGSVVSSRSGVSGPKMDFMHILGQKEAAIWNTIFSIFELRRGPPNVAGTGKTKLD